MPGAEDGLATIRRELRERGVEICLWSHAGTAHAAECAALLNGIDGHACKPDIVLDDEPTLTSTPLRVKPVPGESWPDLAKRVCRLAKVYDDLIEHVVTVQKHVSATDAEHEALYSGNYCVQPIPFFGNVLQARILTVGVNPAESEFKGNRWPKKRLPAPELTHRLLNYFQEPQAFPHTWFWWWEEALQHAGYSYFNGTAAHVDISPRPTFPARQVGSDAFLNMVCGDLRIFRDLLLLCPDVKNLAWSGTVTNQFHMTSFIQESGPAHGLAIGHETDLRALTPAFCKALAFSAANPSGHQRSWPVFYCSVGPSASRRELLVERVRDYWGAFQEFSCHV